MREGGDRRDCTVGEVAARWEYGEERGREMVIQLVLEDGAGDGDRPGLREDESERSDKKVAMGINEDQKED